MSVCECVCACARVCVCVCAQSGEELFMLLAKDGTWNAKHSLAREIAREIKKKLTTKNVKKMQPPKIMLVKDFHP